MFTTIEVIYIASGGTREKLKFGFWDMEPCLQLLTEIHMTGCQLVTIMCSTGGGWFCLPVAAFDGEELITPIRQLKQEWEALLQIAEH